MNKLDVDPVNPKPWRVHFPVGPYTWTQKRRLLEERNSMTAFLGPPRSGKTNGATVDSENVSNNRAFRARDITFLPSDYMDLLTKAAEGDVVEFDEPGAEWGNRAFMSVENRMLNATHITFGSKLIFVKWAVPVLQMQDKTARMLVNYSFILRDSGPRGMSWFYKNWVNAYSGKPGRTGLGRCWWAAAWVDRPEERKEYLEMKRQYQDKEYQKYFTEFAKADEPGDEKGRQLKKDMDAAYEKVKLEPDKYRGPRGKIDPMRVKFGMLDYDISLTERAAKWVADQFNEDVRKEMADLKKGPPGAKPV